MSIDNTSKKVSSITDMELKTMKILSAYALPNTPANSGMKAPQVKPKFYDFALSTSGTSLYTLMVRLITEINAILEDYKSNFDITKEHVETVKGNPHKVTAEETGTYDKTKIDGYVKTLQDAIDEIKEWQEDTDFLIGSEITEENYKKLTDAEKKKDYIYLVYDNKEYYDTVKVDGFIKALGTRIDNIVNDKGTTAVEKARKYIKADGNAGSINEKFEALEALINELSGETDGDVGTLTTKVADIKERLDELETEYETFTTSTKADSVIDTLYELNKEIASKATTSTLTNGTIVVKNATNAENLTKSIGGVALKNIFEMDDDNVWSNENYKAKKAISADSATKATQDANGKVIADTYATKTELSEIVVSNYYKHTLTFTGVAGENTYTIKMNLYLNSEGSLATMPASAWRTELCRIIEYSYAKIYETTTNKIGRIQFDNSVGSTMSLYLDGEKIGAFLANGITNDTVSLAESII